MTETLRELIQASVGQVGRVFRRKPPRYKDDLNPWDQVRDQGLNHGAIALSYGLLSIFENLASLVIGLRGPDRFDLRAATGLAPEPLDHLNEPGSAMIDAVRAILTTYELDAERSRHRLIEQIKEIQRKRLLGSQTPGKLAYVRDTTAVPLRSIEPDHIEAHLIALRSATAELLRRQLARLERSDRPTVDVRAMIERVRGDMASEATPSDALKPLFFDYPALAYRVKEMYLGFPKLVDPSEPSSAGGIGLFCRTYADELATAFLPHLNHGAASALGLRPPGGRGIEVAFAPRNSAFLCLGDEYGDCTARQARIQVDHMVANIHWTVYPWLLDPFYRILEITCDGDRALKAHFVPLIIRGRAVLAVDAVEVIPTLRDDSSGRSNQFLSQRLYSRREEIMAVLFEVARDIGRRMRAEAIYVDKFSNAGWVRRAIEDLPGFGYHVRQVESPFGLQPVEALIREILGAFVHASPHRVEIQAMNLALFDQGLKPGFKEVGVLEGDDDAIAVRGP